MTDWIKTTDRLPPHEPAPFQCEAVLVTTDFGPGFVGNDRHHVWYAIRCGADDDVRWYGIAADGFSPEDNHMLEYQELDDETVTHWMPIPRPAGKP